MDPEYISITPEYTFTVQNDPDGYPAVKIENKVFVEAPRWLIFSSDERSAQIDALIDALTALRDSTPTAP
jgi:hypothetical protein